MHYQSTTTQPTIQPLVNIAALLRAVGMWALLWGGTVFFAAYQGQPGVVCLTPMAWLLALPAGWNYVAFSAGKPGRHPFLAGVLVGAVLGLLFGLLTWGVSAYIMTNDPPEAGTLTINQIGLIFIGAGMVIGGLLSGMMAHRAVMQQRRGRSVPLINVK